MDESNRSLSPSKISTFLACPTKYYWTYQDKRGRWYLRSKSYFSFGTSLHQVLQRFHDSDDRGVTTVHEAVASLEENWVEAGYANHDEMMQELAEGKAMLEAHIERWQREPVTAKTIAVEKLYRRDLGPFELIGRIDRLDEHEDGTLEIIDYKSGRQTVTAADVADDLAMGIYQLILQEHFPGRRIVASIVALRSGEKATASLTDEALEEFKLLTIELGQKILNRCWESEEPLSKSLCRNCDFQALCVRYPDFALPTDECG